MSKNFMYKILLEAMLAPSPTAVSNIKKVIKLTNNKEFVETCAAIIKHWFSGSFMGTKLVGDVNKKVSQAFRVLGQIYQNPSISKVYRAVHLQIPEGTTEEKIYKLKSIQTGPSIIQSWSTKKEGAMWYFRHFAAEQNKADRPRMDRAWVLIEGDINENLKLLTTAEIMTQFLSDCVVALEEEIIDFAPSFFMEQMADHYNAEDMRKQFEVICEVKHKVNVKILDVMVPPGIDNSTDEDGLDIVEMLRRLTSNM